MSQQEVKHLALLNKVVEELNKLENVEYLKETINFFNPIIYIKQKYKPIVGSYQKVKINEIGLWTAEADLKNGISNQRNSIGHKIFYGPVGNQDEVTV